MKPVRRAPARHRRHALLAGAAVGGAWLAAACGGSGLTASPAAAGGLSPSATSTAAGFPASGSSPSGATGDAIGTSSTSAAGASSASSARSPGPPSAGPAPDGVPQSSSASPSPAAAGATGAGPVAAVFGGEGASVQRLFEDATRAPAASLRERGATADDPIAQGIREAAKRAAPGMEPDGALAVGVLREKQNVQTDITLQPGRCYAIVGYSKKVEDVDLYLLLPPGILSAQDTTHDNTPLIGGDRRPLCPAAAVPITYKLSIVAEQGAGEVGVQLYAKSK